MLTFAAALSTAAAGAVALAAPLTAIATSRTFLANAPNIGKKIADKLGKKEDIANAFDQFIVAREAFRKTGDPITSAIIGKVSSQLGANTINNNQTINVNGLQEPVAVGKEIGRIQSVINQESLNRTQAAQGNIIK
jgi:hypothetical protein